MPSVRKRPAVRELPNVWNEIWNVEHRRETIAAIGWIHAPGMGTGQPMWLARFCPSFRAFLERVIGLEPTTFCLGSKHSTN